MTSTIELQASLKASDELILQAEKLIARLESEKVKTPCLFGNEFSISYSFNY